MFEETWGMYQLEMLAPILEFQIKCNAMYITIYILAMILFKLDIAILLNSNLLKTIHNN